MIGIKINNQFLDLYESTSFTLNQSSPLFLGGEMDKIITSFSSNLKLPLTPRNRTILNFPNDIDNYDQMYINVDVELHISGFFFLSGTAKIVNVDQDTITLKIIYNPFRTMKESMLSELDLDSYTFADEAAILAHAKDTAQNPLNHNHAFFPIRNEKWWSKIPGIVAGYWEYWEENSIFYQNYYNPNTAEFISCPLSKSAMPFPRIDYLLEKIALNSGYSIENNFQTTDELKKLYLYNNFSLYDENNWKKGFRLSNHVPEAKTSDLLKWIAKTFALGVIPLQEEGKLKVTPLKTILTSSDVQDWTYAADKNYSILENTTIPSYLGYMLDPADALSETYAYKQISETIYEVEKSSDILSSSPDGLYYVRATNTFWRQLAASGDKVREKHFFRKQLIDENNKEEFSSQLSPLYYFNLYAPSGGSDPVYYQYPANNIQINGFMSDNNQGENPGLRMMLYRGMQAWDHDNSKSFPYAANNEYGPYEDLITGAEYSLLWNGTRGLYEKWWKEWIYFLQNRRVVKRRFILNYVDLVNFSFDKKIKVGNMLYFANNLKINFKNTADDRVIVEAELSTIRTT